MKCTSCQSDTMVLDSRKRDDGIYRRRSCPSCGTRFSTMEIIVAGIKPGPRPAKVEPKPEKKKVVRVAKPAPKKRDYWHEIEPDNYHDDLREAGFDLPNFR